MRGAPLIEVNPAVGELDCRACTCQSPEYINIQSPS
jgi:hypothetical protein